MAGFTAPIDPAGWTLEAAAPLTVPPGLRYAGARLPTLRATRAAPAAVHVTLGVARQRVRDGAERDRRGQHGVPQRLERGREA